MGRSERKHFDLFVAHRIRFEIGGRLHRHQAEQLQQMVLHDVAQGAEVIVIRPAALHADGFGDGDLHMLDGILVPQRLEQGVGEAQRDQVLDGFLAEIVIDAQDAVFAERLGQFGFDLAGRGEIVADGLFHRNAGLRIGQAGRFQMLRDGSKEIRRNGEVKENVLGAVQHFGQRSVSLGFGGVARTKAQARGKARPGIFGETFSRRLHHFGAHHGGEIGIAVPGGGKADNRHGVGQMAFLIEEIEGGEQHLLRQIAGRPENHNCFFVVRHRSFRLPRKVPAMRFRGQPTRNGAERDRARSQF